MKFAPKVRDADKIAQRMERRLTQKARARDRHEVRQFNQALHFSATGFEVDLEEVRQRRR